MGVVRAGARSTPVLLWSGERIVKSRATPCANQTCMEGWVAGVGQIQVEENPQVA